MKAWWNLVEWWNDNQPKRLKASYAVIRYAIGVAVLWYIFGGAFKVLSEHERISQFRRVQNACSNVKAEVKPIVALSIYTGIEYIEYVCDKKV